MDTISSWLACCPVLHIGGGGGVSGGGGSSSKADQEDFVPLKSGECKPEEAAPTGGHSNSAASSTADENGRVADGGRGCVGHYGATASADRKESRTPPVVRAPKSTDPGSAGAAAAQTTAQSVSAKFEDRGLGQLHFVLQFIQGKATLYIRIIKGECLAAQDSNGLSDPYVKVHLLPDTGKRTKLRTRTCQRTLNPIWDEEFCYSGVSRVDMETKMLRLSVLDEDTIGFDWMGEILLPLGHLLHGRKEYYEIPLQPKNFELDRSLKLEQEDRGKIMIGLCYAPAKSELTVRIVQCVNLIAMDPNGYSDPFVKLNLKPGQDKLKKYKTEVKKRTLNPEFNEEFCYNLTQQELQEKTLEITVWDKDFGTKNDFMGALVVGNRCGGERWNHWEVMMKQPYQRHDRWHALCPELVLE